MKKKPSPVAWFDSKAFSEHINREEPEAPIRLDTIREQLQVQSLTSKLQQRTPAPIDLDLQQAVHTPDYIRKIKEACANGVTELEYDTAVVPASWHASLLGAGAVVDAVHFVLESPGNKAFCSPRPPGHHAFADRAGGFCLFNNIAIGAEAALRSEKIQRVAILDWDVHHGNGTQDIFYERDDVFFASIHQSSLYPGTGSVTETGSKEGVGFTLNCPLAKGADNQDIFQVWSEKVRPAFEAFNPDILLISAGFDADSRDPLGGLCVTPAGFEALSAAVIKWSKSHCEGRVVSTLEGGYNPTALGEDVAIHVSTLLG